MEIGYRAVERFSPAWGKRWTSYIEWSGLAHLEEVVGLDCMLCPPLLKEYEARDFEHLAFPEHIFGCFCEEGYARTRTPAEFEPSTHQVLALAREPTDEALRRTALPGFTFLGFELIEDDTETSALTNCGGFPEVFEPRDLSAQGLIRTAARAYDVRRSLATLYPDEAHAQCAVWAIWRRGTPS